jgi:hypothetical protein
MTVEVHHQPQQQRFFIALEDKIAMLEYTVSDEGCCDFHRTYVPFSLRGKGYADLLAQTAVSWATEQGYQLVASCWFVETFIANSSSA